MSTGIQIKEEGDPTIEPGDLYVRKDGTIREALCSGTAGYDPKVALVVTRADRPGDRLVLYVAGDGYYTDFLGKDMSKYYKHCQMAIRSFMGASGSKH